MCFLKSGSIFPAVVYLASDLLKSRGAISLSAYNASLSTTRKRKLKTTLRELRARVNSLAIAYFRRRDPEVRALATQQGCETATQCK